MIQVALHIDLTLSTLDQWFLNLLSNQAWAVSYPGLQNWQPRHGLAKDSRITDFRLGLFVLILIEMASSRQL